MVDVRGGRSYVATSEQDTRTYMSFGADGSVRDIGAREARDIVYRHGLDLPEFGRPVKAGEFVIRRVS